MVLSALSLTLCALPVQAEEDSLTCLATNIYWEARNQSFAGQIAVGLVTINRVVDPRFPDTICDVVYEGPIKESWKTRIQPDLPDNERVFYPRRDRCQFSWYCDGKSDKFPHYDYESIHDAWVVAELLLNPEIKFVDITEGATHYHADYVSPEWSETLTKTTTIDNHIFYRW